MLRRFSLAVLMTLLSSSLLAASTKPAPAVATPPALNTNDGFLTVALFDFDGPVMKVCPFGMYVVVVKEQNNKRVCGQLDTWHLKDGTETSNVTMQKALDMHFGENKTIMVGTAPFNSERAVIFYKIVKPLDAPVLVENNSPQKVPAPLIKSVKPPIIKPVKTPK